jgi:hypothetical protein
MLERESFVPGGLAMWVETLRRGMMAEGEVRSTANTTLQVIPVVEAEGGEELQSAAAQAKEDVAAVEAAAEAAAQAKSKAKKKQTKKTLKKMNKVQGF